MPVLSALFGELLEGFARGLLHGLTEFLPVSSSGHLLLLEQLFPAPEQNLLSLVLLLHGATLLSVFTVFFKDLKDLAFSLKHERRLLLQTAVSLLPLIAAGFFLKPFVDQSFRQAFAAAGFLSTGLLLGSLFFWGRRAAAAPAAPLRRLSLFKAFVIGLAQAIAVLPGFSRSGWTISAGLFLGLSPKDSVYFSFLISLPAIAGSLFVEILSRPQSFVFSPGMIVAFLTAYGSGVFCLRLLLRLAQRRRFFVFSLYLIPLGLYLLV